VYGDAKALEKFRQTITTGFQTATETGKSPIKIECVKQGI